MSASIVIHFVKPLKTPERNIVSIQQKKGEEH